jgi:hypothetical protein
LQTVYSLADLYLLIEVMVVDRHNEAVASQPEDE